MTQEQDMTEVEEIIAEAVGRGIMAWKNNVDCEDDLMEIVRTATEAIAAWNTRHKEG